MRAACGDAPVGERTEAGRVHPTLHFQSLAALEQLQGGVRAAAGGGEAGYSACQLLLDTVVFLGHVLGKEPGL